ncbi:MAG: gliding motility-associated C-terminal domain-containing protein [Bacteroidia bacterium]
MPVTNFIKPLFLFLILGFFANTSKGQCGGMDLVSDQYTLCQPAQFKWVLKNVPLGSSVLWDFGSGQQNGSDTFYAFIDKAGKVAVNVKITLANGSVCIIKRPDFVEVNSTPIPVMFVSRKTLCTGADSVTYFDVTPNVAKRSWYVDGNYYYNTQAKLNYTYKTAGIKKITLVAEDNNGCIGIKEFDSATVIYSLPAIDFKADILTGCTDKLVKFTPAINTYGAGISSYTWTLPGGQPFKQLKAIPDMVNYTVAGVYSPSLEIKTTGGCTYTVTKQNYQAYGTAASLSLKLSDTSVCTGKTVTIENFDKTLPGNFSWTLNGTSSIYQPDKYTNTVSYSATGKYDVEVTYNHNGCIISQVLQKIIRVKDISALFTSGDNYHCKLPHTIHFTNQSKSNESGTMNYQWKIFDGATLIKASNKINDSIAISKAGQYDVSLTAFHSNGCQNTYTIQKFISNKKIDPEFDALYTLGCMNQSIQFIQKTPVSSYQATNKYKWYYYGKDSSKILGFSNLDDAKFTFPDTGFYTIKLVADNGVGCKDSIKKRKFIEIVKPIINFKLTDNVVCKNDILHAVGNSTPAHVNFKYFWYLTNKADGSLIYKESPNFDEALSKAGQYDFKFAHQINDGCRDSIVNNKLVNSNGINGQIKLDADNKCLPFKVKPTLTISENIHFGNASNWVKYKWTASPGTGVIILNDTSSAPQFTFTKSGAYQIILEIKNSVNCSQTLVSQTISAGVKADFSITDTTVCFNQTVTLNDNSSLNPSGIKWILNANTFSSNPLTQKEINARFISAGTQRIGLIANKFNTCFDTIYKTVKSIVVKADLEAVQTVMKCAPVYAKFISHSKNADSLIWNFGDGNKITTSDSFVANIYNKNTESDKGFTLTLIAKSKEGCQDTMVKSNYMKIIGPVPMFSLKNFVGCSPIEVELIDKSKEVFKFSINYGDGTANDTVSGKHTYTTKNSDNIFESYLPKMYATDILGCVAVFESKDTITVNTNPESNFMLSDSLACANKSITITNTTTKFTLSENFVLNENNRILLTTNNFVPTQKGVYEFIQVVTNANNCMDSVKKTVNILPNPVANFVMTDTLCLSKPVNFKNISTSEYPLVTYNWEIKNPSNPVIYTTLHSKYTFGVIGLASVKLTLIDNNNCQSSFLKNLNVVDPVSIPTGELKAISVNPDNSVNIESRPSGYYRFLFNNFYFNNSVIHSSNSQTGTIYNQNLPANLDSICVDMSTTDVCGYESGKSIKHCTMFLTVNSNKVFTNQLTWTPYIGWPTVTTYSIYRKKQTDLNYLLIKTLPNNTYSWLDSGLCNTEYSYYILATYNDAISKSNSAKSFPQFIYPVLYSDIKNVSVINTNAVEIKWEASKNSIFGFYTLYRTNVQLGITELIKVKTNTYVDKDVNSSFYNYIYRVAETDLCHNSSQSKLEGKTILLNGSTTNYKSLLNWNTYKSWTSGVKSYTLQLEKDGHFNPLYVTTNADSLYSHSQQLDIIHGPYCYRVIAISNNGMDSSFSNVLCIVSPSTLFFPNAFSPNGDGFNEKISAKSLFVYNNTPNSGRNFNLEIYDRWGGKIFQSNNIDEEWDGKYQGKPVQSGVYIYHLKAIGADYRSYYLKGTISVLP